jgi:peptide/nickel transport system substrate-binding protein/oligopeptide transport system substrate-binding protein
MNKPSSGGVFFIICIGVILSFAACAAVPQDRPSARTPRESAEAPNPADDAAPGEGEPGFAESRPQITNREELIIAVSKSEFELDFRKSYLASEAQLFTALYEGLFSYHPFTMEPVPAAASHWRVSDDKKEWTFTIRETARYWNGDPVRAEDFQAAWLSLLSPARRSPYSSLFDIIQGAKDFRMGRITDPKQVGIEAAGARLLIVRLTSPASFFPSMLCHHSFSPIHPSMLEVQDWSRNPPLANGPYLILSNTEEGIVLGRNELYWGASQVVLKKITLKFAADEDEAAELWNSGEARWVSGEVNLNVLRDRDAIIVNPMFATHYYFIRSGTEPWNDSRIRLALALALPWDTIREGHILPAKTLIYPIPGYPEIQGLDTTDVEEAQRLFAEAGYSKGVGLPDLVIRLTPSTEAARIGSLMAQAWMEKLGVPVKIDVVPFNQYFDALKKDDYGVGFSTWIGDFADPYTFLQMWRRDSNLNDAGYDDADYEDLMEKSMQEEGEARFETLAEAEKLLLNRGVVFPISYSPALNIIDMGEVDGWFPNALDVHPYKYLSFKEWKPLPGVVLAPQRERKSLNRQLFQLESRLTRSASPGLRR